MPMSNTKSDAPTDVILNDAFATGQATPSQSVWTPSTIQRDERLSQYTRDPDSVELSDTPSLDEPIEAKSEGRSKEPQTTADTTPLGPGHAPAPAQAEKKNTAKSFAKQSLL